MIEQTTNFIISNWGDIIQLILAIIGGASIVVKWTKTPKDDEILGIVKNFISKWIALNPKK